MTNSRRKGAKGELEIAKILRDYGWKAHRAQQYKGSKDSADVICELPIPLYVEVKRREKLELYKWMEVCNSERGPDDLPVIFHRKDKEKWLCTLRLSDFLDLVKFVEQLLDGQRVYSITLE